MTVYFNILNKNKTTYFFGGKNKFYNIYTGLSWLSNGYFSKKYLGTHLIKLSVHSRHQVTLQRDIWKNQHIVVKLNEMHKNLVNLEKDCYFFLSVLKKIILQPSIFTCIFFNKIKPKIWRLKSFLPKASGVSNSPSNLSEKEPTFQNKDMQFSLLSHSSRFCWVLVPRLAPIHSASFKQGRPA